jgi:hypothetical protein
MPAGVIAGWGESLFTQVVKCRCGTVVSQMPEVRAIRRNRAFQGKHEQRRHRYALDNVSRQARDMRERTRQPTSLGPR